MQCDLNQEPYKFKDFLEQSNVFTGLVVGYSMASGLNLEAICYGDTFAIGNADNSSESQKIDRMFVLEFKVLMEYITKSIKDIENWKVMQYGEITDDMLIFKRERIEN